MGSSPPWSPHHGAGGIRWPGERDGNGFEHLQVVVENGGRVAKIAVRERVLPGGLRMLRSLSPRNQRSTPRSEHVVAQGPKLLPLQHQRVKVAQSKQDGPWLEVLQSCDPSRLPMQDKQLDLAVPLVELLPVEESEGAPARGERRAPAESPQAAGKQRGARGAARLKLAWRPWGGSLVSLMDRSSKPMGIPNEGSAERKSRK